MEEREALRNAVPKLALDAPLPGGGRLIDMAGEVLDIAENSNIVNKSGAMPWFVSIGQVPSTPAGQTCYLSTHLHMEGRSETGGVSRHASGCNGWLSAATSVVYSWTW